MVTWLILPFAVELDVIPNLSVDGLHRRHVGGQNKRNFVLIVCIKIEVNSQRRKILLFMYTNMAAMTSHANHQLFLVVAPKVKFRVNIKWFEPMSITAILFAVRDFSL